MVRRGGSIKPDIDVLWELRIQHPFL